MAGDQNQKEEIKKIDVVSDTAQKSADAQAGAEKAKEAPDARVETLTAIQGEAKAEITRSNINMVTSGQSVDDATQKYLNEYFQGSIDRFDKDKDGKISAAEAKEFKAKMMEKTRTVISDVKEAGKKSKEVKEAAANVKQLDSKDVEKSIGEITDISANGKLDLKGKLDEFEKMQKQNQAFQQSVQSQINSINEFGKSFGKFQEKQKGAEFIWSKVKGIFSNSEAEEEQKLRQQLETTKAQANQVLTDLTAKKAILDKNSETVKSAIAAERQRIIKERDEKLKEIAAAQSEQKEAIDAKKKRYGEFEAEQKKLEERKKGIEAKQANVAGIQKAWTEVKAAEQWENRKKDMTESTKDAQAELEAMDILLNEPNFNPEAKEKVKVERAKIVERLKRGELGIKMVEERMETGKKVEQKLSDEEKAAAGEMNSVSQYLDGQLKPAKDSLEKNIANMEELKMQYATEATQVTDHYNKRVDEMDKISEGVNDYAFASATARNKSLESLKKATESLNGLTVERRSAWHMLNPGTYLEAVGQGFMAIAKWIDGNSESVLRDLGDRFKETNSVWGKIGYGLAYGLTQVGAAFAGFVSGGCELIGGVFHMAAHPIDSLNGLGTLLGMNVKEGKFFDAETFKAAWTGMGKAIIGYDQFEGEKQNYGGAVGKFAFNVMSVFVGGGAGAGAKAADAANIARVAEVNAALAKAGANVGKFESVASKLAALEKVDAALAKTTQSAARSAYVKTFAKTIVYESLPQFTKNAATAGREAVSLGKSGTWAVTKSLAGSAVEGVKAVGRGIKAAPRAIAGIYGTLLTAPISAVKGIGRMAGKLPEGWRAFRGEGLMNTYRASKMAEAGKVITAESGQYAKARAKIAEIIERDPELSQLAKEGEFGLAAAEGKARLKLMREDPALAASYSKVEEASKNLTEHSKEMAQKSLDALEKVKNNPELKYEVAEYERLKAQAAEAKVTYDNANGATPAPKAKPQVVTEPLAVENVDRYLDNASKKHGWNAEQKAHMREEMLASDNLRNTPAGKGFVDKMDDIAKPFIDGSQKFPTKSAAPKISEAEAKAQLDQANKALRTFEENPDRMKYVKQNEEAVAAEKNLKATLEQQQNLFAEYTGSRNPELAALESEIGEAAARHGETPGRPAIKDTPEVIKANYDSFIDAVKSGDAQKIERARAEFGPRESNSLMSKKLDAAEQIAKETPAAKQARADAIQKFEDACKKDPDLAYVRDEYMKALEAGEADIIDRLKKLPNSKAHVEALAGLELEHLASPKNFFETYMKHQDGLYNMYRDYNKAWAEGNTAKLSEIRQAHPDLVKAFDQLDLRHKVLDRNQAIAHDVAAARIKADLLTQKFPEGTTAKQAAEQLSRRYSNDKMQLGVSNASKEITTLELLDDSGKPAKYTVRLEANGEVLLIAEDLKPVIAPKASPAASSIDLDLAKTKVKVFEEDLVKVEKEITTAKAAGEYKKAIQLESDAASIKAKINDAEKAIADAKSAKPKAPLAESMLPETPTLPKGKKWDDVLGKEILEYVRKYDNVGVSGRIPGEMRSAIRKELSGLPSTASKAELAEAIERGAQTGLKKYVSEADIAHYHERIAKIDIANFEANLSQLRSNLAKVEGELAAARQTSGYRNVADLEARAADLRKKVDSANLEVNRLAAEAGQGPYRTPEPVKKLTADEVKKLEADIAKAEGELNTAKGTAEYKKVADLEEKIKAVQEQLAEARKQPVRVRIATPGETAPVSNVAKLEGELAALEKELVTAKAAPEYKAAAQLESDLARLQSDLALGRPAEALAKGPDKPIATRLREADAAVEAAKVDLLAEQKALRTAKENLRLTEETYLKAKESGRYSDAAINNLKGKVDKAREAVLAAEGKVASLEEALSAARSDYRSALLLRGGEKVLEKLASPLRSKWIDNLKNKLLALPGVPKDIILGLTSLLGEQARLLTFKAFQGLNKGFGKAFRSYVSQLIAAEANADVLRRLLAPVTMEQLILTTQLLKGRMPDAKERAKFSDLALPEKLAVLEEDWNKIEKGGHVTGSDFYNGAEQDYIKDKRGSLAEAVGTFEDQEGLTADTVIANLDNHFGPAMNDTNKTYEINHEGITVTVAADGTRTYSGIEDWIADQPKRKLVKNTFAETVKEYGEMTPAGLKKLNGDKPVDSVDTYKKHLSDQITAKLAKQLENQEISRNMTIKSKDVAADGQPVFIAHVNEKGQIFVEIHNEWAGNSYNAIKARPDKPAQPKPRPTGQPRPKPVPAPTGEVNTDAIEDSKLPPISPGGDVYT